MIVDKLLNIGLIVLLVLPTQPLLSAAWVNHPSTTSSPKAYTSTHLLGRASDDIETRREVISNIVASTTTATVASSVLLSSTTPRANAAQPRCDPGDRRCGPDGKLREEPSDISTGVKPIPRVTNRITHVVQLVISVGERREETGFLRFGLYGEDCPSSTRQMLQFLTSIGIGGGVSAGSMSPDDLIGMQSSSVSLLEGGIVPNICSQTAVEFGIPSQSKSYASSRGLMKAENFLPQNRPDSLDISKEPVPRPHDVAGLISIPLKGIGYANEASNDLDTIFASAFLVTADTASALDKNRRVVGQIIDDESMQFLERLANLPVQKGSGVKGILPGQMSRPPLLKVQVRDIGVQKVGSNGGGSTEDSNKKGKSKR